VGSLVRRNRRLRQMSKDTLSNVRSSVERHIAEED
jgi:hypothetical protein